MRYAVILEKAKSNYSVYVPDLPGCISVGDTEAEAVSNIREAIILHLEGIAEDGERSPESTTLVAYVEAS